MCTHGRWVPFTVHGKTRNRARLSSLGRSSEKGRSSDSCPDKAVNASMYVYTRRCFLSWSQSLGRSRALELHSLSRAARKRKSRRWGGLSAGNPEPALSAFNPVITCVTQKRRWSVISLSGPFSRPDKELIAVCAVCMYVFMCCMCVCAVCLWVGRYVSG